MQEATSNLVCGDDAESSAISGLVDWIDNLTD
jgi:hypothetical protein